MLQIQSSDKKKVQNYFQYNESNLEDQANKLFIHWLNKTIKLLPMSVSHTPHGIIPILSKTQKLMIGFTSATDSAQLTDDDYPQST